VKSLGANSLMHAHHNTSPCLAPCLCLPARYALPTS
jgi:hypothetical protein